MDMTAAYVRNVLQKCYAQREAANLTRIICCEMLGQSTVDYYLGKGMILSPNEKQKLESILVRLCNFEPLQYIQGFATFLGRRFFVNPSVLIPRPETEELVERMLAQLPPAARILDIGTGSGCIAVTLAKELPASQVTAWDVSEAALAVARANGEALQADVKFEQCDVLACSPAASPCYDAIVSNPPYVTETEKREMERNVLDWEPHTALFVPDDDPLRFYRKIAALGLGLLFSGGRLYFEINRAFGAETAAMLTALGYVDVKVDKDISGNDRFVTATRGLNAQA